MKETLLVVIFLALGFGLGWSCKSANDGIKHTSYTVSLTRERDFYKELVRDFAPEIYQRIISNPQGTIKG
jgi:hypothetical protein